jgi:4-hydroxyproline epimerase
LTGDVAYGGNWFFLVRNIFDNLQISNVQALTDLTRRVRDALRDQGIRGDDGHVIDHIALYGPPSVETADSRNFVLCPSGTYDRSPCGTGTSAKMACLAEDGLLVPGQIWRQESFIGSIFEGSIERAGDRYVPTITGSAWVNAESTLILDPRDPFRFGVA